LIIFQSCPDLYQFFRNFDDFNPYFRFFWDHQWWSILQQVPSACIKYILHPIRIVPSQDLGDSCDCLETVLFCKLHCSFINWTDYFTTFCKSSLSFVTFSLILEIVILISIHILIRWNIQPSVAAMETNDTASAYLSKISMCRQTSATF
jgi:hypothetical protein